MSRTDWLQRELAEWVHGLTGGEAEDELWHGCLWYDGLPDWYASNEMPDDDTRDGQKVQLEYRTAHTMTDYLPGEELEAPGEDPTHQPETWTRVRWHAAGGEPPCPMHGVEDEELAGPACCLLCESLVMQDHHGYEPPATGDWANAYLHQYHEYLTNRKERRHTNGHGLIYLGELFVAVYEKVTLVCFLCDDTIDPGEMTYQCSCGISHAECSEEQPDADVCNACNGSGEGMYDGSTCWTCGGSGEEKPRPPHCEDIC